MPLLPLMPRQSTDKPANSATHTTSDSDWCVFNRGAGALIHYKKPFLDQWVAGHRPANVFLEILLVTGLTNRGADNGALTDI